MLWKICIDLTHPKLIVKVYIYDPHEFITFCHVPFVFFMVIKISKEISPVWSKKWPPKHMLGCIYPLREQKLMGDWSFWCASSVWTLCLTSWPFLKIYYVIFMHFCWLELKWPHKCILGCITSSWQQKPLQDGLFLCTVNDSFLLLVCIPFL
jgi:hypothetical protein